VRFFCDNNLSPKIAHALHCLAQPDHEVIHLRDRFAANVADVDWLKALANEEGWAIISADTSIARNPHEAEAWRQSGHPIFFFKHALLHLPPWEQAPRL
jgi:predicted nuclease of predicted toxin-antitoxin system